MTKQHIPKIRFQGFDDEWEEETLSNIAEIVGGGTPSTKVEKYWNGEINWFSPTEIGNTIYVNNSIKKITELGLKNSSARLLPANRTILFTSRAGIGDAAILISDATTNQGFQSLVLNDDKNIYFIYSQKDKIKHYALKHSAGSTFLEISGKELRKMKISLPSLPEQESIGQLFRTLDELISAYKGNLEHYQSLKTSMLSKMFPKEGQKQPEIRLNGFEGDWENVVLGDIGNVLMNKRIFKDETSEYEEIPFYKIGTFGKIADSFISRQKFEEYKAKYPYPQIGDILISASGSIGKIVEYKGEDAYFQDSNIVWLNHGGRLSNSFLKQFYQIVKWDGVEGTTIKRLYNKNILNTKISLPSLPEQEAIGALFANLDETISSYKDKIGQLELLKKNLLSQMFI